MNRFDYRGAAVILERVAVRHREEATEAGLRTLSFLWDGYPYWHRLVHEAQSEADAAWDRYYSLRDHIQWLYAEDAARLADLGMSR